MYGGFLEINLLDIGWTFPYILDGLRALTGAVAGAQNRSRRRAAAFGTAIRWCRICAASGGFGDAHAVLQRRAIAGRAGERRPLRPSTVDTLQHTVDWELL